MNLPIWPDDNLRSALSLPRYFHARRHIARLAASALDLAEREQMTVGNISGDTHRDHAALPIC
jgi:hypothetical protein